jgi:hypothetical protein
MNISYDVKLIYRPTYKAINRTWKQYSMPFSSASFHIMVTFIHGRIIMGILVYYGVGPLVIQDHACMVTQSNSKEAKSACLCHSYTTKNSVILKAFHFSQTLLVKNPER